MQYERQIIKEHKFSFLLDGIRLSGLNREMNYSFSLWKSALDQNRPSYLIKYLNRASFLWLHRSLFPSAWCAWKLLNMTHQLFDWRGIRIPSEMTDLSRHTQTPGWDYFLYVLGRSLDFQLCHPLSSQLCSKLSKNQPRSVFLQARHCFSFLFARQRSAAPYTASLQPRGAVSCIAETGHWAARLLLP